MTATTKMTIPQPRLWYVYNDEKNFFQWLEAIPAVEKVVGVKTGLELTIRDPIDDDSLRDLIGIMTRYDLDRKCLRAFCNAKNSKWFENKTMY